MNINKQLSQKSCDLFLAKHTCKNVSQDKEFNKKYLTCHGDIY